MRNKIKLPTKKQIKKFWQEKIVELKNNIFDSVEYLQGGDYCFACGILTKHYTERAHILARSIGGSDDAENLHLLCPICHKESEMLDGDKYWDWFKNRSHVDTMKTIVYKYNYKFFNEFHDMADEMKEFDGMDVYSQEFLKKFNYYKSVEIYMD